MSREAFDVQSVGLPGQPNRTTASRPYKDLAGVPITLSDGTIVLALLTAPASGYAGSSTSTQTHVTASATSVALLPANPARKSVTFFSSSVAATWYIAEGTSASIAAGGYAFTVGPGASLTLTGDTLSLGAYNGITSSADSSYLNITERT